MIINDITTHFYSHHIRHLALHTCVFDMETISSPLSPSCRKQCVFTLSDHCGAWTATWMITEKEWKIKNVSKTIVSMRNTYHEMIIRCQRWFDICQQLVLLDGVNKLAIIIIIDTKTVRNNLRLAPISEINNIENVTVNGESPRKVKNGPNARVSSLRWVKADE